LGVSEGISPKGWYTMGQLHVSDEFDSVIARIDDIAEVLQENAEKSEERGRLTDESQAALRESGALAVGIPASLGGYEFSPRQLIDAIARMSYHDAGAGWNFMVLQMISGTTAAYLDSAAAAEIFPDVRGGRYALVAGQGTRFGQAARADGGYRVSGHWQFASGMAMATHIHTAGLCEETGEALLFTVPVEQATLLGNWDVMGLRGTSSIDYTMDDVFVPEAYSFPVSTTTPRTGGAVYHLGVIDAAMIGHTGWAIGVGRRLLDEMRAYAVRKSGQPGAATGTGQYYAEFAQAEARMRSAAAWISEVWTGIEAALDRGEKLSAEQETLLRLSLNNVTDAMREVSHTVYKWAGTTALRRGVLQRLFRDVHAGTQHVTSGPAVLQDCGKWLSGLAPQARWDFLQLDSPA